MAVLEVHLWCARLDAMDGPGADALSILDEEERRRAGAFRFARDRRRFVSAHLFLRQALAWHLGGTAEAVRFRAEEGKPQVVGAEIEFSLSRSGEIAMCGIAGVPIGVDIERRRPLADLDSVAQKILTAGEQADWAALDGPTRLARFYDAWTRKEALGKAEGHGITPGPETIRVPLAPLAPHEWSRVDGTTSGAWLLSAIRPNPETLGHVMVRAPAGAGASGSFVDEPRADEPPARDGVARAHVVRRFALDG